jgi:diadenosine tetraphosphate (Ap4A) HIT family hydrolase
MNALAAAFADGFPLSPGHALIVPRLHEADVLALSSAEQATIRVLVPEVCRRIKADRRPGGSTSMSTSGKPPGRRSTMPTATSSRATGAT